MNKKVSLGVTISLAAIACAITFVLTMTVSRNMYDSMVSGIQEREAIYQKIKEIDAFVRDQSYYTIDEQQLIHSIMHGYISGINDEYAKYYTADEYYEKQQRDSGVIITAGIEVTEKGGYLEVQDVYSGSSAMTEEIKKGDIITAVDGKDVLDIGALAAKKTIIRGDDGTKFNITITDTEGNKTVHTLVRQSLTVSGISSEQIGGYAYIKITSFNALTTETFLQVVEQFEAKEILGYVFDLRGCSEGMISPLTQMLNRFCPKNIIAAEVLSDGTEKNLIETDGSANINKPVVVLTNSGTRLAAEIFASALKDYCKADIVGTATAGVTQIPVSTVFKDGSAVSITYSNVSYDEGFGYGKSGIVPAYIVELNEQQAAAIKFADPETDPQLKKAIDIISSK